MWGERKFLKQLTAMTTHELGRYPQSHAETADHILKAIEAEVSKRPHDADWAEGQLKLGDWYCHIGRTEDSSRCYRVALRGYYEPQADLPGVGRVHLALCSGLMRSEEPRYAAALRHVHLAREAFTNAHDAAETAWCEREQAHLLVQQARMETEEVDSAEAMRLYREAGDLSERALPVLRASGEPLRLADCLTTRAISAWKLGNSDQAAADCREARALFQRHGDPGMMTLCDMYAQLVSTPPWPR
jgi:tetratricopeptide (TPR) repeat protein